MRQQPLRDSLLKRRLSASELPEKEHPQQVEYGVDEDELIDKELEMRLAKQAFNDLTNSGPLLTKEAFMEWEDIKEVLESGTVDSEVLDIIYKEAGVLGDTLTFEQFVEVYFYSFVVFTTPKYLSDILCVITVRISPGC